MANKKRRRKKKKTGWLSSETKASILAIFLIALAALVIVSFTGQGKFLQGVNDFLSRNLGFVTLILPFLLIAAALALFKTDTLWSKPTLFIGALVSTFGLLLVGKAGNLGGSLFANLANLLSAPGVYVLGIAIMVAGVIIMLQLSFQDLYNRWSQWRLEREALALEEAQLAAEAAPIEDGIDPTQVEFVDQGEANFESKNGFSLPKIGLGLSKKVTAATDASAQTDDAAQALVDEVMTPEPIAAAVDPLAEQIAQRAQETGLKKISVLQTAPPLSTAPAETTLEPVDEPPAPIDQSHLVWEYPSLDLLDDSSGGEADRGDIRANAQIIQDTLDSFGIRARVVEVNRGPSVTQYALEIAMGTKISKITSLSNNLALALAAPNGQIRIEAPIAGKSLVGIEVPNFKAAYVTLKHMLSQDKMQNAESKLAIALGIDVSNSPVVTDIARMPHALIAGATGSGKSVGINALLCSILFRASPNEVRLILVDPKRVEMTPYNDIPHLLTPVIYDVPKIISALKWLTAEMDHRYELLAEAGVRNIVAYNQKAGYSAMYSIVLVIDEFADIMMYAPSEVEECVVRLTQKARAVGIHTILATQRPSVNVVTGLIKGNIPTRIAFNVASITDSRVILDVAGAEKLLGNGDMLYMAPDKPKPVRVQGTYVSDEDVVRLTDFLRSQEFKPEYMEEITTKYKTSAGKNGGSSGVGDGGGEDRDALFDDAARIFAGQDVASSSAIQRRLSVGYARAARIIDQLHAAGLVGPANGSKPREINHEAIMQHLSQVEG